jgi:hypothetical protein
MARDGSLGGMKVFGSWLRRRLWQVAIVIALLALFVLSQPALRTH